MHFSIRRIQVISMGLGSWAPGVSAVLLTSWVTLGRLLNFLKPRVHLGKNDDDNSTYLIGCQED